MDSVHGYIFLYKVLYWCRIADLCFCVQFFGDHFRDFDSVGDQILPLPLTWQVAPPVMKAALLIK